MQFAQPHVEKETATQRTVVDLEQRADEEIVAQRTGVDSEQRADKISDGEIKALPAPRVAPPPARALMQKSAPRVVPPRRPVPPLAPPRRARLRDPSVSLSLLPAF